MMIIRGVNVFPSQIEDVLIRIDGLDPHYQILLNRQGTLDTIEVRVEVSDRIFSKADEIKSLQKIEQKIVKDLKDFLGVTAKVKLVEPNSLPRFEGKASRVIDNRDI